MVNVPLHDTDFTILPPDWPSSIDWWVRCHVDLLLDRRLHPTTHWRGEPG
jgi:hypothetical protein